MVTKVKICGITNLDDAVLSADLGAEMLGFNFYEKSPRYVSPQCAGKIAASLSKSIYNVGVFVNESVEKIISISDEVRLDAIQLHGEESPQFVSDLLKLTNCKLIKAFRVSDEFMPEEVLDYDVQGVLLDGFSSGSHGGTGNTFDWGIAKSVSMLIDELYLAGGLSAENVADAIAAVRPHAVDVASGVETAPGKKDAKKLEAFIRNAKSA